MLDDSLGPPDPARGEQPARGLGHRRQERQLDQSEASMWSRDCRSQSQLTWRSEAQETASCSVHQVENRETTELSSMIPT